MYDVVSSILDLNGVIQEVGIQQIVICICGALIIMFSCVLVDICYRIFSHFWR